MLSISTMLDPKRVPTEESVLRTALSKSLLNIKHDGTTLNTISNAVVLDALNDLETRKAIYTIFNSLQYNISPGCVLGISGQTNFSGMNAYNSSTFAVSLEFVH